MMSPFMSRTAVVWLVIHVTGLLTITTGPSADFSWYCYQPREYISRERFESGMDGKGWMTTLAFLGPLENVLQLRGLFTGIPTLDIFHDCLLELVGEVYTGHWCFVFWVAKHGDCWKPHQMRELILYRFELCKIMNLAVFGSCGITNESKFWSFELEALGRLYPFLQNIWII